MRSPIIERSNRYLYDEEAVLTVGDGVGTGKVFHYVNGKYDIHQRVYRLFDFSDDIDAKFFYHWFSENFYNRVMYMTAKTSVDSVRLEMIADMEITAPSYDEQKKISSYLDNFDNLITLHQCKCNHLLRLKDCIFSFIVKTTWEQRKLGEISLRESTIVESSDDNPSVEYEDVVSDEGRLNKDIQQKDKQKNGIAFNSSHILYGKLRPYLHNWLNPDFNGAAVGDWWVLKPNTIDKNFLYRLIQTEQFDNVANQSSGSKMPRADWNLVSNAVFAIPHSIAEQSKIAKIFTNLDNLITLHQSKLKLLKQIKQSMQNGLFIKNTTKNRKELENMTFKYESDFEETLINLLSNKGWEKDVIKYPTESELLQNWANILFDNNRGIDRLNNYPLTEGEMQQVLEQINSLRTPIKLNEFINGKTVSIKRDNPDDLEHLGKEISLKIYDRREIAAGQSRYQIVQQPVFPSKTKILNDRRGDLMLLINGMPVIHIELKKSGVPVSQACNQIEKYSKEGIFTGLFSLVQVFVAMTPNETRYFANPGPDGRFNSDYYFKWADFNNEPINDWKEIASSLLSIPMAHQLIGFYTIADESDGILKVMRSYQYYAANAISDKGLYNI